jgi:hypothetical protein
MRITVSAAWPALIAERGITMQVEGRKVPADMRIVGMLGGPGWKQPEMIEIEVETNDPGAIEYLTGQKHLGMSTEGSTFEALVAGEWPQMKRWEAEIEIDGIRFLLNARHHAGEAERVQRAAARLRELVSVQQGMRFR